MVLRWWGCPKKNGGVLLLDACICMARFLSVVWLGLGGRLALADNRAGGGCWLKKYQMCLAQRLGSERESPVGFAPPPQCVPPFGLRVSNNDGGNPWLSWRSRVVGTSLLLTPAGPSRRQLTQNHGMGSRCAINACRGLSFELMKQPIMAVHLELAYAHSERIAIGLPQRRRTDALAPKLDTHVVGEFPLPVPNFAMELFLGIGLSVWGQPHR